MFSIRPIEDGNDSVRRCSSRDAAFAGQGEPERPMAASVAPGTGCIVIEQAQHSTLRPTARCRPMEGLISVGIPASLVNRR